MDKVHKPITTQYFIRTVAACSTDKSCCGNADRQTDRQTMW
jgi:hypothetical protein